MVKRFTYLSRDSGIFGPPKVAIISTLLTLIILSACASGSPPPSPAQTFYSVRLRALVSEAQGSVALAGSAVEKSKKASDELAVVIKQIDATATEAELALRRIR